MTKKIMEPIIITPHGSMRVVDYPEFYGGGYDLVSGRKTSGGQYSKSAWAHACISLRGQELANLPWQISRNGKVIEKHEVIDLLTKFGEESNYAEVVAATEADLLLHGQAFWLRDADLLQRLNAGTIEVVKKSGKILYFKQTIDGKTTNKFAREDITYFREFHPDDDLGAGVPVMEVIKTAVFQEYEASIYVARFFKSGAVPSILLTSPDEVPEAEQTRFLAWWNRRFMGTRKSHGIGIIGRGVKPNILSQSLKDNALVEIRDQARSTICVGMRTPKILIGSMEDATYANAQEARKFMIEDLIIPRSKYYEGVINADLISRIDPTLLFEFIPDLLPILQEDKNKKWGRLFSALKLGVISDGFVREEMGWPESVAPEEDEKPSISTVDEVPPGAISWSRKAKKALKQDESANVPFETEDIPERVQTVLRASLESAETAEDVDKIFFDTKYD